MFLTLRSKTSIHHNQNGKKPNSPEEEFNDACPHSFDAQAKDKGVCGFWDARGSLVGKYVVRGDSGSIIEDSSTLCPVATAELFCGIHS